MADKVRLVIAANGVTEEPFEDGQAIADFLAGHGYDVAEFTIIVNGEKVSTEEAAERPLRKGDVVVPVREVTNG